MRNELDIGRGAHDHGDVQRSEGGGGNETEFGDVRPGG